MKNSKTRVMFIMCIAMAIMAIGYAYFATNLDITATGNITTNWKVNFISITSGNNGGTGGSNASTPTFTDTTATMSANLQVPGDYMEYDLVLKNSGSINAIIEDINAIATGSPAIIFSISGINEGDKLAGGASKTIKIKIEYDLNVTSQPTDTTKTLTVSIKAVQDTGQTITNQSPSINQPTYLSSSILRDNVAQADTNIDFSEVSSDTNGKGLYYTSTNTENNAATYYFRGNVNNNYVKFGTQTKGTCLYNGEKVVYFDTSTTLTSETLTESQCKATTICSTPSVHMVGTDSTWCGRMSGTDTGEYATYEKETVDILWRIVRINEDGSIRLITNDTVGNERLFYTGSDMNDYVGYIQENSKQPSSIKVEVDNWYEDVSNLGDLSNYLADTGFCNDRSVAPRAGLWDTKDTASSYDTNYTVYGATGRLADLITGTPKEGLQPQFKCPNESRDLFTTSLSSKGNKKLTYPIGLLTADEAAYAGGVWTKTNENMYLITGKGFWTMSPFSGGSGKTSMWVFGDNGNISSEMIYNGSFARPVVNLKSTVELSTELPEGCTKLDGTEACPYIIKTN